MKNKKCLNCGGVVDYKEWKRWVLHPTPWLWEHKLYCCRSCQIEMAYKRQKEKKNKNG